MPKTECWHTEASQLETVDGNPIKEFIEEAVATESDL